MYFLNVVMKTKVETESCFCLGIVTTQITIIETESELKTEIICNSRTLRLPLSLNKEIHIDLFYIAIEFKDQAFRNHICLSNHEASLWEKLCQGILWYNVL